MGLVVTCDSGMVVTVWKYAGQPGLHFSVLEFVFSALILRCMFHCKTTYLREC